MDNTKKTGKADDVRINVNQDHELAYWSQKFGCTKQELRDAVKEVGVMVADVRKYLKK
jgi:hypothetical protein